MYMLLLILLVIPQLAFAWTYYQVARQPKKVPTWERETSASVPALVYSHLTLSQCILLSPRMKAYRREVNRATY